MRMPRVHGMCVGEQSSSSRSVQMRMPVGLVLGVGRGCMYASALTAVPCGHGTAPPRNRTAPQPHRRAQVWRGRAGMAVPCRYGGAVETWPCGAGMAVQCRHGRAVQAWPCSADMAVQCGHGCAGRAWRCGADMLVQCRRGSAVRAWPCSAGMAVPCIMAVW
eukprot:358963-Chlamydomonas_euryale.AAC.2